MSQAVYYKWRDKFLDGGKKGLMNSNMRSRWMATALLQIERRMRKVNNHKKLDLLRTALKTELKIKQKKRSLIKWSLNFN